MAEQSFVNCTSGGAIRVDVADGTIVRVRPLVFDESDAASWTLDVEGREYTPPRKSCVAAFSLTERARVYSDERIQYPMKRVDFDPDGERNPQNRGKSGYERISWDEALDLVAGEMKRIREKYGPEAITSRASSHHNWGNLGYRSAAWARFFSLIGFTDILDNPDSWEGWHWGATHAWGFFWRLGNPEHYDLLEDALRNTELIIQWGNDPDTTHGIYGGNDSAAVAAVAAGAGHQDHRHRPLLQLHGRARGRQVDRLPAGDDGGAGAGHRPRVDRGRHLRPRVRRRPDARVRRLPRVRARRGGRRRQDAGLGRRAHRRAGAHHRRAGARVGLQAHLPGRRDQGRRRRGLPAGLRHRERPHAGAAAGHAGPGQAGRDDLGHGQRAAVQRHARVPRLRVRRLQPHRREAGREPRPAAPVPAHRAGGHPERAHQLDGRGLLRQLHRAAVHEVHLPDARPLRGQDVLPLRRRLPGHHDRHQPLGAHVPEPQPGVRREPGLLVVHRDEVRRRGAAGVHQPGARGHRRVGELRRLLAARLGQRQPPRDRLPAEVHRAGRRVEARLRHLRRAGPAPGRGAGVHRGQHLRGLDPQDVRQVGPAPVRLVRGLQGEGLLRRPADRGLQADAGPALVRRGPALRHARHQQPQARHRQGARAGDRERQARVRLPEPAGAHAGRRRALAAAALARELGGAHSPSWRRSTRSR